ncbi:SDR family NAD(P)-dependent oxidoreductase [Williamsia maris]|nr:SDR family oxidoreductase [Williamsia maris]
MALPTPSPTATALVTGASSGIGADIARELVRRGHGVTLVARREDRLRALADELSGSVRIEVVACDMADASARATLLDTIAERGLTLDILVNNAGVGTIGSVATSTVDAELSMVRVNVEAVIDLCTRAVAQMVPRGRGAILNVGSTAAYNPFPGQAGYAASKAFVVTYSEALRAELHGSGVTVATLCPGPVRTEFLQTAGMDEGTFAEAFPEFMWVPAREVADLGVDAIAEDHGTVVPGLPNRIAATAFRHLPRRLLLPVLAKAHPALKQERSRR